MEFHPTKPTFWIATYLKVGTTVVIHGQRFSCTLALIVTAPDTCHSEIVPISKTRKEKARACLLCKQSNEYPTASKYYVNSSTNFIHYFRCKGWWMFG